HGQVVEAGRDVTYWLRSLTERRLCHRLESPASWDAMLSGCKSPVLSGVWSETPSESQWDALSVNVCEDIDCEFLGLLDVAFAGVGGLGCVIAHHRLDDRGNFGVALFEPPGLRERRGTQHHHAGMDEPQ